MIETGVLKKRRLESASIQERYDMRRLDTEDLPRIMTLQALVVERLARQELVAPLTSAQMAVHIGVRGFIIGVFVAGELIAFRNTYFPEGDESEWNLGRDIGFERPEDLRRVANFQMICVHPDFRGNGLGRRLNLRAIEIIRRLNRFDHVCATVAPTNHWNIQVLLDCGFCIRKLKHKYGGRLRYIAHNDLIRPLSYAENALLSVCLTDIRRQEAFFQQRRAGVQLRKISEVDPQTRSDEADGFELLFADENR